MKKSLLLLLIIISGFVAAQDKTGPGGNESAPNHANYDESVATPYPAKDLGVSNDYKKEVMPPYKTGMLDGHLAWRQHDGGHTDAPNMKYFIEWASRLIGHETPVRQR